MDNNQKQVVITLRKKTVLIVACCVLLALLIVTTIVLVTTPKTFEIRNFDLGQESVHEYLENGIAKYRYELCPDRIGDGANADFSVFAKGREISLEDVKITVTYQKKGLQTGEEYSHITYCEEGWLITIMVFPIKGGKYEKYQPLHYQVEAYFHR